MRPLRLGLERWRRRRSNGLPATVLPGPAPALWLARRSLLRLPDPAGRTVRCVSGALWITVDGDADDVVLCPGEQHQFLQRTRAIVSALEDATFMLLDRKGRFVPSTMTGTMQLVES
jgi:hypothetical protein